MQGLPNFAMDRRALLRGAILLVGGSAAGLPSTVFAQGTAFFTPAERTTLDAVCDALIPATDTPGAVGAGVPGFLDSMMTNWAVDRVRTGFRNLLVAIDATATQNYGKAFAALSPEERASCLAEFDEAQFAARSGPWPRFKELALTGYYLSEVGATQELRYELAPGVWEPSIPMTADTRAWAV